MGSAHEDAADLAADQMLRDGDGPLLVETKDALAGGAWPSAFTAAFADSAWNGRTYGQITAFLQIDALIRAQRVALVRIGVGAEPLADRMREENAAALRHTAGPFAAELDMAQKNADEDGWVSWSTPFDVSTYPGRSGGRYTVPPGTVPLEVGSCKPSRVAMHLWQEGGIARWPYGGAIDLRPAGEEATELYVAPRQDDTLDRLELSPCGHRIVPADHPELTSAWQ